MGGMVVQWCLCNYEETAFAAADGEETPPIESEDQQIL